MSIDNTISDSSRSSARPKSTLYNSVDAVKNKTRWPSASAISSQRRRSATGRRPMGPRPSSSHPALALEAKYKAK